MVREIARLSSYLRTFGNVCHPDDRFLDDEEDNIIEKRREAEIIKRRLIEKRRQEENGGSKNDENLPLFGANIPFKINLDEIEISEEDMAKFSRPNPGAKFQLRSQINFNYEQNAIANQHRYRFLASSNFLI